MLLNATPLNAAPINGSVASYRLAFFPLLNESAVLSDNSLKFRMLTHGLDEPMVLYSTALFKDWTAFATDTVTMVDNFIKSIVKITVTTKTELMVLSDQFNETIVRGRNLADSLKETDSFYDSIVRGLTESELLVLADQLSNVFMRMRSEDDVLLPTDQRLAKLWLTRQQTEPLIFTDTLYDTLIRGRTKDELLIVVDQLNRVIARGTTASDSLSATDALYDTLTRGLTKDQVLALVDAVNTANVRGRTAIEPMVLVDQTGKMLWLTRMQTEALLLSDNAPIGKLRNLTTSQGLTLLDAVLQFTVRGEVLSDALTLVDNIADRIGKVVVTTDGIVLYSQSTFKDWTTTFSDPFTAADSTRDFLFLTRAQLEAFVLSDGLVQTRVRQQRLDDGTTLADALLKSVLRNESLGDGIYLTDAFTTQIVTHFLHPVLDDALTLYSQGVFRDWTVVESAAVPFADFVLKKLVTGRVTRLAMDDLLVVLDLRGSTRAKVAIDAFVFNDTQGRFKELVVSADDAFKLSDATTKPLTKVISDLLTLSSDSTFKDWTVTESDIIAKLLDSFSTVIPNLQVRKLDDLLLLVDSRTIAYAHLKTLIDSLIFDDVTGRVKEILVSADELPLLADSVVLVKALTHALTDVIVLTDTFARGIVSYRMQGDFAVFSDGVMTYRILARLLNEHVAFQDFIQPQTTSGLRPIIFSDTVTITDPAQTYLLRGRTLGDNIARMIDDRIVQKVLLYTDNLTIADGFATFSILSRQLAEFLSVTDDETANVISALHGVFDVRVQLRIDPSAELGMDVHALLGHQPLPIQLGVYN